MRTSRLISVILSVLIVLSSCATVFAQNDNLSAIGITEKSLKGDANGLISRAEFSYLVSKVITPDDMQPVNTKFSDIGEKNEYSGYVAYLSSQGIINGVSETAFNPDGNVSKAAASKILIGVLGFNAYAVNRGGYPDGYLYAAQRLGLFNDLYAKEENLTRAEALKLLENTLLAINGTKAFPLVQSVEGFDVPDKDENIYLTTKLGYSIYRGVVESVNVKNNSISFYLEKNVYDTNNELLGEKSEYVFDVAESINPSAYLKVPVLIWTDRDGNVTLIRERNGYSSVYGMIEAVNEDDKLTSPYNVTAIDTIKLTGHDEVDLDDICEFFYNGTKVTSGGVDLADCYVRMIEKNGVISTIYCYKMQKGGLIKSISSGDKVITYTDYSGATKKWKEAETSDELLVCIDGRVANFAEIKANSVFDYYKSGDVSILAISERTAFDVFSSYSEKSITLGAFTFETDTCLYSKDGKIFKTTQIATELLNNEVEAFFAPNGKVAFVIKSSGDTKIEKFYGVVNGVLKPSGVETDSQIELYKIGAVIEKKVYVITEKTKFALGLDIEVLDRNKKNTEGAGVYYFTANAKGEIKEVSECTPFSGYGEKAKWSGPAFTKEILPSLTMPNKKIIYFDGTPIIALFNDNGEFTVAEIEWTSIYGRGAGGTATMEFFSAEELPQPEIAILCADISNIAKSDNAYGIITKKSYELNAKGEKSNVIEILASNGTKSYFISDETFAGFSLYDYVLFGQRVANKDDQLIIKKISNFSEEMDNWNISLSNEAGLQRGIVRKIDSKRLYIESDSKDDVYFMHPYACFCVASDSDRNSKFYTITANDIEAGDKVCYYLVDGEIRVIIAEK